MPKVYDFETLNAWPMMVVAILDEAAYAGQGNPGWGCLCWTRLNHNRFKPFFQAFDQWSPSIAEDPNVSPRQSWSPCWLQLSQPMYFRQEWSHTWISLKWWHGCQLSFHTKQAEVGSGLATAIVKAAQTALGELGHSWSCKQAWTILVVNDPCHDYVNMLERFG